MLFTLCKKFFVFFKNFFWKNAVFVEAHTIFLIFASLLFGILLGVITYHLIEEPCAKYAKMKYIDEILFSYRWHSNNTVKERDYLINITKKTLEYEANLIKKMDFSDTLSNVKNISQNGVCYKKIGIPFLFQVLTYRHILFKIKVVKFFGLTIFRLKKNYG